MAAPRRPTPVNADDLEQTAELPVIDFSPGRHDLAAGDATARVPMLDLGDDALSRTDVYVPPPVAAGAGRIADNLRDLEERLGRQAERAAALERELETVRAEHDLALREARSATARAETQLAGVEVQAGELADRLAAASGRLEELEASLAARERELGGRVSALESELAARAVRLAQRESELAGAELARREQERQLALLAAEREELRLRAERQLEALHRAQGRRDVVAALVADHQAELAAQEQRFTAQAADYESRLAAERASIDQLSRERDAARAAHEDELRRLREEQVSALERQRAQLEQDAADEREQLARAHDEALARERAGRESAIAALTEEHEVALAGAQAEQQAAAERAERAEGDLRAAEEQLRKLEAEQRHREARAEELARGLDNLQTRFAEAQHQLGERDERLRQLEAEAQASAAMLRELQQSIQRLSREDVPVLSALPDSMQDPVARLLVRVDGDAEVVHVLGRRTTIGRTPDNDIRLDVEYVSRHHAVLLSSPQHTIVEDLNSTNGVLVNGRRVSRQPLHDGDVVAIGNAQFRFQLRPAGAASERA